MSQASDEVRISFKASDDLRDEGLTTPEYVRRFDDIRYGTDADCQLLDVYRPKYRDGEKLPVIINVHGGGWVYGTKETYQFYCMSLTRRGFAVVNFTYRLAPEYKFPASLEDTNLVVKWVLTHGDEYGFDTEHIFMVGDSAGAHMLGLYAGICTNPDYAAKYNFAVPDSFKPTAIALNCGIYSLLKNEGRREQSMDLMDDLFEDGVNEKNLMRVDVLDCITEDYVPTCCMTCTGDFLKPQAGLLYEKLLSCSVPCVFQFYGDKDHRLGHVFHANVKLEIADKCNDAQCEFFRSFL